MKKVLFIILLFIFGYSCSVKVVPVEIVDYWDYTPLTSKGIFVTESNSVSFNYTTLGSVYIELREGKKNANSDRVNVPVPYDRKLYSSRNNRRQKEATDTADIAIVTATIDDALDKLYTQLVAVGANGIINLQITRLQSVALNSQSILGPGYAITGMAIKK